MEKIRTIVVDDHELFRKGIVMVLESMGNVEVVAQASNGKEYLEIIDNIDVDLVIMDIKMPEINGIEASRISLKKHENLKIIALSMYADIEYYNRMIDAGIKAFVLKNSDIKDLENAVNAVMDNKTYFSQELLLKLVNSYQHSDDSKIKFSDRESEVLKYICEGLSNSEIAEKMYISPRTVESHRRNLLQKTGSKNSIQLVIFAIKNGYFSIE